MSRKYLIMAIIISFLTSLFLGIVMPNERVYRQDNIEINISMRSDLDTEIKLYYLEQDTEKYAEERCLIKGINKSEEFQTIYFELPVKKLKGIRIDCEPPVVFWDIELITLELGTERITITAEQLDEFNKNDITAAEVKEGYITLRVGSVDPYLYTNCSYTAAIDKTINYRYLVMGLAFIFMLAVQIHNRIVIMEMLRGIMGARKQIKSLAFSDFKSRFSGSYLGMVWGIIQPIMTILLFWFVFQVGFRSQPISNAPFILWLVAGMIPWNFFSDAWMSGNGAYTGYSYIVKKLVFNIDILPLVKILSASILNLIFHVLIIGIYTLYGRFPGVHLIDMIYFAVCLTALAWGLTMITATLNVFLKDVGQFLGIVMQFLMWLTPIMWDYHMLKGNMTWFYRVNPLFYVINGYREALIDGKWFFNNYYMMIWFWIITIVVNIIGIRLMKKLKPHFADVL